MIPTQSQTANTFNDFQNNLQQQSATNQQNLYTPGQQALENQLTSGYSNLLNGQVPSQFTNNPQLIGAYQTAYNAGAPATAFQGGAGSPQMQSNYAQGLQSLLANQYNTGITNYANILGGAGANALTGTGSNTTNQGSIQSSGYGNGNFSSTTSQSLIAALLGLGGG
jgi:hypothetical protein